MSCSDQNASKAKNLQIRGARISCSHVRSTQSIDESFGWRWEPQRGSQGKAERRLRRNFNLLVSGKRSPHESCSRTYERTNACSLSSPSQSTDQRSSSRASTGGSSGALTLALNRAAQHIGLDWIGLSLR